MTLVSDIEYARLGDRALLLDLYLPEHVSRPPLIIWIHGGAWSFGTKEDMHVEAIIEHGFAVASIDFRNSPEAPYPAQIHDLRASIRNLRANADELGVNAEKVAAWGYSSGGHLAALLGSTNGNPKLEGVIGDHLNQPSSIQAAVDFSGPANLLTILGQSTPHGFKIRVPALQQFMGAAPEDPLIQQTMQDASPALRVNRESVPLLIMHGMQDNQVPINQALELEDAYKKMNLDIESNWLVNSGHTSGEYFASPYIDQVAAFLDRTIR